MAAELPSGTVTFLFSDIEGSTRLLHRLGDEEFRDVVERHRAVLRAAITAHRGLEVRTEGDAFFVAFNTAADAVGAAIDAQLALVAGSDAVRVRMGLHTGAALVSDGDYYGLSVHQAARIAAAAHGGQVLVSASTAEQAGGGLPDGTTFNDLGEHRLKDLERPQQLLQLCDPRIETNFPPPQTLERVRHNLPVQASSFVGRQSEIARVHDLLASSRLVTLLGPGGTGKTRLAYQSAVEVVDEYPDGVWVAELAPVINPALVAEPLLAALGLREQPGRIATETVVDHLRTRCALLVLDNCEHLVEGAAGLARELLRGCRRSGS
ncbi:MAG: adenylate/guanylate cyclase domain-containing protein [Candidatus Dormibacteria bacterium]